VERLCLGDERLFAVSFVRVNAHTEDGKDVFQLADDLGWGNPAPVEFTPFSLLL